MNLDALGVQPNRLKSLESSSNRFADKVHASPKLACREGKRQDSGVTFSRHEGAIECASSGGTRRVDHTQNAAESGSGRQFPPTDEIGRGLNGVQLIRLSLEGDQKRSI